MTAILITMCLPSVILAMDKLTQISEIMEFLVLQELLMTSSSGKLPKPPIRDITFMAT